MFNRESYLEFCAEIQALLPETVLTQQPAGYGELANDAFSVYLVGMAKPLQPSSVPKGVVFWEDQWRVSPEIIASRIESIKGFTERIFARDAYITQVDRSSANEFMNVNHLGGATRHHRGFALKVDGETVAVATFSKGRTMKRGGRSFRSFELIRYANVLHTTVVGGVSKLLSGFEEEASPDDIMTYVDASSAEGGVFEKLGFEAVENTEPVRFRLDDEGKRIFPNREERFALKSDALAEKFPYATAGNIKWIKYFQ